MRSKVSTRYKEGKLVGRNEFGKTGIGNEFGKTGIGELDLTHDVAVIVDDGVSSFVDDTGVSLLPELHCTSINKIGRKGISISGIEQINGIKYYQEWWCRVGDWSEG